MRRTAPWSEDLGRAVEAGRRPQCLLVILDATYSAFAVGQTLGTHYPHLFTNLRMVTGQGVAEAGFE